jgi:predicted nucleic-acid-binding protein
MMKHESLDTNVLMRFVLQDVPQQYKQAKDLLSNKSRRYFVSDVMIFEFIYGLETHYQFSREQISDVVKGLLTREGINCNREVIRMTLSSYVEHKALSYADCYFAASARFMNATPLWTFDKDLAKKIPEAELLT